MGPPGGPNGHGFPIPFFQMADSRVHDQFQAAADTGGAEQSHRQSIVGAGKQILQMFDDDVAGTVEERRLIRLGPLNLHDLNVKIIESFYHFMNTEDDRSSIVVSVG